MGSRAARTFEPSGPAGAPGAGERLRRVWQGLPAEQRLAAAAALGLVGSMVLPWYQQNAVVTDQRRALQSANLSALGVFSWVEASILLLALATLVLLFARAESRAFHLPGGDGTIVLLAGAWAVLLLVWRLFDKPSIETHGPVAANVGIQWGMFCALLAAGLLALAGTRIRAKGRPEPPILQVGGDATPTRRADYGTEVTRPLNEPRTAPTRAVTGDPAAEPLEEPTATAPAPRARARRAPPSPVDQLTLPHGSEPPLSPEEDY